MANNQVTSSFLQGSAFLAFGNIESNAWQGGNPTKSLVGFQFNVTAGKTAQSGGYAVSGEDDEDTAMGQPENEHPAPRRLPPAQHSFSAMAFDNGCSISAVDHEDLTMAQQDIPRRNLPRPQPIQPASSAPVQLVSGTKRKANDCDFSHCQVEYNMVGADAYEDPADPNCQHAALAKRGGLPRKYLWGTSRLRRGARDISSFASKIKTAFTEFGSREPANAQSIPLHWGGADTKVLNPYKRVRHE